MRSVLFINAHYRLFCNISDPFFSVNLCALLLLRHELSSGSSNSRVTLLQLYDTNMSSDPSNFRAYDYDATAVATTGADDVDDDDDDDEGE